MFLPSAEVMVRANQGSPSLIQALLPERSDLDQPIRNDCRILEILFLF